MAGKPRATASGGDNAAPGPLFEAEVAAVPASPPQRARLGAAPVALVAALVAAGLWGAWVTKSVLGSHDRPAIAKVQLSGIVGEYVQAQARSATPPEQVTTETRAFMSEIQRNLERRGAAGQIVLVGEAVVAGPTSPPTCAAKSMPGCGCPNRQRRAAPTSWVRCVPPWQARRRRLGLSGGRPMPQQIDAQPEPLSARGSHAKRWLAIGALAACLAASSSLASWRDEHAILINTTQSLPNWAFWIDKQRVPQRGDFVVFKAPQTPLITAHFGKIAPPFAKRVYGMPGDVVSREGAVVRINGAEVARLKPASSRGEKLEPGPTGRIPDHCYYLGTAHKDGLDSRYADIGFVCAGTIIGTGDSLL